MKREEIRKKFKNPESLIALKVKVGEFYGYPADVEDTDVSDGENKKYARIVVKSPNGKYFVELDVSCYGGDWKVGGIDSTAHNHYWNDFMKMGESQ